MKGTVILAYCRAGFEPETRIDLTRVAEAARMPLDLAATPNSGIVTGTSAAFNAPSWKHGLRCVPPIFARSVFVGNGPYQLPGIAASGPRADRLTPLLAAMDDLAADPAHSPPWRYAWVEYPDTNEGKSLAPLARALQVRIDENLRTTRRLTAASDRRLHVLLTSGEVAYVGTSETATGSRWPLGIPRLARSARAPSRSTLKLAEAFTTFLGDKESTMLRAGLHAVDLGAAPGGWTWQLTQRGLRVTAVDNGALKGEVATNPLVTHLREDGLRWRPRRPVDWLVCDIVEQPLLIADLMARWIVDGAARRAIFNLKLPMKKRHDAVTRCVANIAQVLGRGGMDYELRVRQLYHDREEVTAYLARK